MPTAPPVLASQIGRLTESRKPHATNRRIRTPAPSGDTDRNGTLQRDSQQSRSKRKCNRQSFKLKIAIGSLQEATTEKRVWSSQRGRRKAFATGSNLYGEKVIGRLQLVRTENGFVLPKGERRNSRQLREPARPAVRSVLPRKETSME